VAELGRLRSIVRSLKGSFGGQYCVFGIVPFFRFFPFLNPIKFSSSRGPSELDGVGITDNDDVNGRLALCESDKLDPGVDADGGEIGINRTRAAIV
jgi:hypothetical protein